MPTDAAKGAKVKPESGAQFRVTYSLLSINFSLICGRRVLTLTYLPRKLDFLRL